MRRHAIEDGSGDTGPDIKTNPLLQLGLDVGVTIGRVERDTFSVVVEEKSERRGEQDEAVKCKRGETPLDAEGRVGIFRKEGCITHPPLECRKLRAIRELRNARKLPDSVSDRSRGKRRADRNIISDGLTRRRAMGWGARLGEGISGAIGSASRQEGTSC